MLSFRDMRDEEDEYQLLLLRWFQNPLVLEWFGTEDFPGGVTLDNVKRKYNVPFRLHEGVRPCILESDGRPVGYAQYYPTEEPGERGIDLFIGENSFRDRGNGTQFLHLLSSFLFQQKEARSILLDPKGENRRAIRCYEKAGFRLLRTTDDGRWIMARGRR